MPVSKWIGLGALLLVLVTSAAGADDSVDALFTSLADTDDPGEAREIERKIWVIWNDPGDETLESLYRQGRGLVQIGQLVRREISSRSSSRGRPTLPRAGTSAPPLTIF